MTREKGVDYTTHHPSTINFVPQDEETISILSADYDSMLSVFIYKENPIKFNALMEKMKTLQERFRSIQMGAIELSV
jgi:hypothetical protein